MALSPKTTRSSNSSMPAMLELGDGFRFTLERAAQHPDLPGAGQRWHVTATLAGRVFERAAIDVAFAAAPVHPPELITTSNLLEFAGIDGIQVPALGIEQQLAEKLHAYTRTYAGGRASTRVKDLLDIVVIANTSTIDAGRLTQAIAVIFARRAEHAAPEALPAPPAAWARPWSRLARGLPAARDIAEGHSTAVALLNPVLDGRMTEGTWRPGDGWPT
jgi:hypothetical protein